MALEPAAQVQADLERLLPVLQPALLGLFEGGESPRLKEAMRYSLEAGGKRIRPVLCLLAAESVGGSAAEALPCALALELIHTYSLIHDDLPAMDDDDLRRGRPTSHKVFGEGHAILAGDGLLTEAFAVLAGAESLPAERRVQAAGVLAEAAGWRGMVGGQALDLEAEAGVKAHRLAQRDGSQGTAQDGPSVGEALSRQDGGYDLEHLRLIHRLKTGALLRASLELGAIAAGAAEPLRSTLRGAGAALGLAFQIQDDILDATSTAERMGKRVGKDQGRGKITYPALLGLPGARQALQEATENALCLLQPLPVPGPLSAWARFLAERSA